MIDAWAEEYPAGVRREFPVAVINDLPGPWKGSVRFRLLRQGTTVSELSQACEVAPWGREQLRFTVEIPRQPASYQLEAALVSPGAQPVRSLRDFDVLTEETRRIRREACYRDGIAAGRAATASSVLATRGAAGPAENVTDGKFDTRWASESSDPQWIALDLGQVERISRVLLDWTADYAKAYVIEVSLDGHAWKQVYATDHGRGTDFPWRLWEEVSFAPR